MNRLLWFKCKDYKIICYIPRRKILNAFHFFISNVNFWWCARIFQLSTYVCSDSFMQNKASKWGTNIQWTKSMDTNGDKEAAEEAAWYILFLEKLLYTFDRIMSTIFWYLFTFLILSDFPSIYTFDITGRKIILHHFVQFAGSAIQI